MYYHESPDGKIEIDIPVEFAMSGYVRERFDSVDDLKKKLKSKKFLEELPIPTQSEYVSGSYLIDEDLIEEIILENK